MRKGRLKRLIALLREHAGEIISLDDIIFQYTSRHTDESYGKDLLRIFGVWMRRAIERLQMEGFVVQRLTDLGRGKKAQYLIDSRLKIEETTFQSSAKEGK